MNLLQIFFIISGIIISILAVEIARKQKFNAFHFLVFIFVGFGLLTFTFFPEVLSFIGSIFGIPRGADVLVYTSIVFLVYFVLLLLRKVEQNKEDLTSLIKAIAVKHSSDKKIKGKEVFIVPSYNEAQVIVSTVQTVLDAGYKNVIVVNDGSSDDTVMKLEKAFGDSIIVLSHYKNRGQGAALETGFEYVRKYGEVSYVITFDADGQHSINDVKRFEEEAKDHPKIDVFLGSRFLTKKQIGMPFSRRVILKLGIVFTSLLSNIHLTDTHNGFRLIRLKALDEIKITIDGMGHASEVLDIIAEKKIPFKEVPVHIVYTEYSPNKGQSTSNAISIALKMIRAKFFK